MYKILIKAILGIIFVFGSVLCASAQDFQVIVHNSNTNLELTKKQVSNYFLKKNKKWPSNSTVQPIDLSSKSVVRKVFSSRVHRKTVAQVRVYWQQAVFSGKGSPPIEKTTEQSVIDYVKANIGAIGYISSDTKVVGVKVVTIKK